MTLLSYIQNQEYFNRTVFASLISSSKLACVVGIKTQGEERQRRFTLFSPSGSPFLHWQCMLCLTQLRGCKYQWLLKAMLVETLFSNINVYVWKLGPAQIRQHHCNTGTQKQLLKTNPFVKTSIFLMSMQGGIWRLCPIPDLQ